MGELIKTDICIIGAGAAGLSVAAGASQMGARVVLIEGHRMGGDCLYTGCVPSKSLIAAASAAHASRSAARLGVHTDAPTVDFAAVHGHIKNVIAAIEPHDSEERFTGLGCRVIRAHAHFVDRRTVAAGDISVRARRFVIATGSRPAIPDIPGLSSATFFTNETIFDSTVLPDHLIVLGGGPIGVELAQSYRRLGARVTLIEQRSLLGRDDPEAVGVVRSALLGEGVDIIENAAVVRVDPGSTAKIVLRQGDAERHIEGSHLLIATGRKPNVENLKLENAAVDLGPAGIVVDARLRTTNKRIYAAGDVAGQLQFTHVASHHAGVIIRNALFRLPAKHTGSVVPRVTFSAPELAQVGATEAEARSDQTLENAARADFSQNDRVQTNLSEGGFLKVIVGKRGQILGVTIVGPHAGELLLPWVIAINKKLKIGDVASSIVPYPTLSEISKRAAGAHFTPSLYSPRVRRLVCILGAFG